MRSRSRGRGSRPLPGLDPWSMAAASQRKVVPASKASRRVSTRQTRVSAPQSLQRYPELQARSAAGSRFQYKIRIQRSRAAFETCRTEPQKLQLLERVRAGEVEAVAVVVDRDFQAAVGLLHGYRHS